MFLQALSQVRQHFSQWLFVIAGVDEFGHLAQVQAEVTRLELQDKVRFVGPLFDQDKRDAFDAAELFVLPSHSEGAPMVILEALGAGIPVLATQASPWKSLIQNRCGWWTEITRNGLMGALEDALVLSSSDLREMGRRGRLLVKTSYTWMTVGGEMLQLYRWLHGNTQKPDFVLMD